VTKYAPTAPDVTSITSFPAFCIIRVEVKLIKSSGSTLRPQPGKKQEDIVAGPEASVTDFSQIWENSLSFIVISFSLRKIGCIFQFSIRYLSSVPESR